MFDDNEDFPPTAHPEREVITLVLAGVVVLGLALWGLWWLGSTVAGLFNGG
jgi:hypothetical protein